MTQQPMRPGRTARPGVARTITLRCVDPWGRNVEVPTTLRYRAEDPYAVSLVFRASGGDVEWVVARTLLLQGLAAPTGEGDVHVGPDDEDPAMTTLDFCSPDGRLVARADTLELQAFLAATSAMVPVGTEGRHLDLDGLVEALLAAG